jgi:hypothetical protein
VGTAAWLLDQEPLAPADPADPGLLQRNETLPGYRELRALPPRATRAVDRHNSATTGTG